MSKKILGNYEELKEFLETRNNYKALRSAIKTSNPPLIPYLGIYLSDLTFIEDGNPVIIFFSDIFRGVTYEKCRILSRMDL